MTEKVLVHLVVHCAPFISLSVNKPIGDQRNVPVWVLVELDMAQSEKVKLTILSSHRPASLE